MESQKSVEDMTVDARKARNLVGSGHRYLDVRMKEDYEKGHVQDALNIPFYSSVTPQGKVKNPHFVEQVSSLFARDEIFIVGCGSGVRSKLATLDLFNAGFKNVKNIGGGYRAWVKSTSEEI